MKYKVIIELPKEEELIILSIYPDKKEEFKNKRAKIEVIIENKILVIIKAIDNTSFRAAINSFLRFYNFISRCLMNLQKK